MASTTIKYIYMCHINDPAKSKCSLLHGCDDHYHGGSGAFGGKELVC